MGGSWMINCGPLSNRIHTGLCSGAWPPRFRHSLTLEFSGRLLPEKYIGPYDSNAEVQDLKRAVIAGGEIMTLNPDQVHRLLPGLHGIYT
jgi:hypothetical protein